MPMSSLRVGDAGHAFRFRVAEWHDRPVLARMLELYQYDLSHVWPQDLDLHGEYGFAVDRYLRNPRLCAILFLVDNKYAGGHFVEHDLHDDRWGGFIDRFDRSGERRTPSPSTSAASVSRAPRLNLRDPHSRLRRIECRRRRRGAQACPEGPWILSVAS